MKDMFDGNMDRLISERLDMLDDLEPIEGSEFDRFGASRDSLEKVIKFFYRFYKYYFRTETHGIEQVAAMEKALIVANHMVIMPVDGMNVCCSFLVEPEQPRLVRAVMHYTVAQAPFMSVFAGRAGQVIGSPPNVDRLFQGDNLILLFPEGADAVRPYTKRYRLAGFKHGFMEYAIAYGYPIVPTAIIGSEESIMLLGEIKALKGFLGMPRFVVNPTFPLLGPLGFLPYPAKFRIYYGEPMDFSGYSDSLGDPAQIARCVEMVREKVQSMLDEKLAGLPDFPFF